MPDVSQDRETIFALDIGTRSIVGVIGKVEDGRLRVLDMEKEAHGQRAMLDGQIEDIGQVAAIARRVVDRLQQRQRLRLKRVCVAAAGRALLSHKASFTLKYPEPQRVTDEIVSELETGAVSAAEAQLTEDRDTRFYMVGYTAAQYRLDGYPMSTLQGHHGQRLEVDIVATFLPREVVDSLYAVVSQLGLEVASLTLEPIASLNAAVPVDIRLLNIVLVDIGAGTSDIAVCRDGSVAGYTMATVAGDEVTEQLMRQLLVDFQTGEQLKTAIGGTEPLQYEDILGVGHECTPEELREAVRPATQLLAKEISDKILELNGVAPSAIFLAGGGSKLYGLRQAVARQMEMDEARVATAGNHFAKSVFSDGFALNDPELSTPLGIAVSAGLDLISDSYMVTLNGEAAKLFRSGTLTVRDILLMNGYHYTDIMGRTGANLTFTMDGQRMFFRGTPSIPSELQLNGKETSLSAIVHAGDSIRFTPAKAGVNASRTLADLVGEDFAGWVLVNGTPTLPAYQIRTGDVVETTLERPEGLGATQPPAAPQEPKVMTAPQGVKGMTAPVSPPKPVSASGPDVPPPGITSGKTLTVRLNGEPLRLSPKPDGEPYYLMDILDCSGLDFEHLTGPVEMTVNGKPGQFSQQLKERDEVIIRRQGQ